MRTAGRRWGWWRDAGKGMLLGSEPQVCAWQSSWAHDRGEGVDKVHKLPHQCRLAWALKLLEHLQKTSLGHFFELQQNTWAPPNSHLQASGPSRGQPGSRGDCCITPVSPPPNLNLPKFLSVTPAAGPEKDPRVSFKMLSVFSRTQATEPAWGTHRPGSCPPPPELGCILPGGSRLPITKWCLNTPVIAWW